MKKNWGDLIIEIEKNTKLYNHLEKKSTIDFPEGLQRKKNDRYVEEGYYFDSDNEELIGMCKLKFSNKVAIFLDGRQTDITTGWVRREYIEPY